VTTRRWAALALLGALPATAAAQPDLEERLDRKLAEPWLSAQPWFTDYDEARARAAESGRVILAFFTKSYAP